MDGEEQHDDVLHRRLEFAAYGDSDGERESGGLGSPLRPVGEPRYYCGLERECSSRQGLDRRTLRRIFCAPGFWTLKSRHEQGPHRVPLKSQCMEMAWITRGLLSTLRSLKKRVMRTRRAYLKALKAVKQSTGMTLAASKRNQVRR